MSTTTTTTTTSVQPAASHDARVPPGVRHPPFAIQSCTSSPPPHDTWIPIERKKRYTLAFLVQGDKVLMGRKKRGFAVGMWNGFGGKIEKREEDLHAARREFEEEAGVVVTDLKHIGTLVCAFETDDAPEIEFFIGHNYTGEIQETDEMAPAWFALPGHEEAMGLPRIPVDDHALMHEEAKLWMPLVLRLATAAAQMGRQGRLRGD